MRNKLKEPNLFKIVKEARTNNVYLLQPLVQMT